MSGISLREQLSYGLGDLGCNLILMTISIYGLYFYTDVYGLSAAAAGSILMVSRIWDGGFTLFMGLVADRAATRWGRYRPFILIGAVPLAIIFALTFYVPEGGVVFKYYYALITFCALMTLYSFVNVPYSSMLAVLSDTSEVREKISSYKFALAFLGGLIVMATAKPVVSFLKANGVAEKDAFFLVIVLYAVILMLTLFICFFYTRERVDIDMTRKNKVSEDMGDLLRNKPWIVLAAVSVALMAYVSMRGGVTIYYFKYYIGNSDLITAYFVVGAVAVILGSLCITKMRVYFPKVHLYVALILSDAFFMALYIFIEPDQLVELFLLNFVSLFLVGPSSVLLWSMYADTVDYSRKRTGRSAAGLVFSGAVVSQKVGVAIGVGFAGLILSLHGFAPNAKQDAAVVNQIVYMMSIYPALIAVLAAALMKFYAIGDGTQNRLTEEPLMDKL